MASVTTATRQQVLNHLRESLKGTDFDFILWSKEKLTEFNLAHSTALKYVDFEKLDVRRTLAWPESFVRGAVARESSNFGIYEDKDVICLNMSFSHFLIMIRATGNIYKVKIDKAVNQSNLREALDSLDDFTLAYIRAALWSSHDESTPDGGEPMDENYEASDLAPGALRKIILECARFQTTHAADLALAYAQYPVTEEYSGPMCAGHDFWLTRNGHGCGFWDRDELDADLAIRLTDAAKACGTSDLYVGDDKKLYVTP